MVPLTPFRLPPAELPRAWQPEVGPVTLRPLTLADNAAAFVLSEIAFTADGQSSPAAAADRQSRWATYGRAWFGWLHAQAGAHAWAATCGADGPLIGYARAIRDPAQRREQLTELFIHPRFQQGQVGKALLGAVLAPDVPEGWTRVIIADPAFPALALYHRWGVFPLGTAWHARLTLTGWPHPPAPSPSADGEGETGPAADQRRGDVFTALRWWRSDLPSPSADGEGLGVGPSIMVSAAGGYGVRCGGALGPVVGATPENALEVVLALIAEARDAGETTVDLWVPGANVALLRWLRGQRPQWDAQVALLASDPTALAQMDRALLVNPPYVW